MSAVELAQEIRDPQALYPDLAMAAAIFVSVGNERRAEQTVTEAVEGLGGLGVLGFAALELPYPKTFVYARNELREVRLAAPSNVGSPPWLALAQAGTLALMLGRGASGDEFRRSSRSDRKRRTR